MIETIYIEQQIAENIITKRIIEKLKPKNIISCNHYKEIFNLKKQNFRVQKNKPSMILAKKNKNFLLETPKKFTIGGKKNYYFSHMYNCIFDCQYCYLQGMFNSANYVIFVNYESFVREIEKKMRENPEEDVYFFSGYTCDSLALENTTNFADYFIKFFNKFNKGFLEFRTKSCQIQEFLKMNAVKNIIFAWSLNPDQIIIKYEHKTPDLKKRIDSIISMQKRSWNIGLRFDPIIFDKDFEKVYDNFFDYVFQRLDIKLIHSVTLGNFRLPNSYKKTFEKNSFKNEIFYNTNTSKNNALSDQDNISNYIMDFCIKKISKYLDNEKLFIN